jgi:hypothetical protein
MCSDNPDAHVASEFDKLAVLDPEITRAFGIDFTDEERSSARGVQDSSQDMPLP